ncbi:MAG: hypothetical protein ABIM30_01220 [candidate division WOR-3 bacterium]
MSFPTSNLSGLNILRDVHDKANQALRTTATATIVVPPVFDVDISHTEDSVRLGDGTNFITSTSVSGKTAIDVNTLNTGSTLTVHNLFLALNTVEYTFSIPINTKRINLKSRIGGKLKINFNASISTSFISIPSGAVFYQDNLLTQTLNTLYVQSSLNGDTLEIMLII